MTVRRIRGAMFLTTALVLTHLLVQPLSAETPAAASFAKLKMLAGQWRGQDAKAKPTSLSYEVLSGGAAVLETFKYIESGISMTTVYYLDGDSLMLTHFCISKNQPRMRADSKPGEPNVLHFSFVDATNLASPNDGHMHEATLRFVDADNLENQWVFLKDGKVQFAEVGRYVRVR